MKDFLPFLKVYLKRPKNIFFYGFGLILATLCVVVGLFTEYDNEKLAPYGVAAFMYAVLTFALLKDYAERGKAN